MVYNDTLYLYTGHDEDGSTYFTMNEWRVYSTTDMVNWTDHGAPLSYKTFTWAKGDAWAGQCIERNGKFYWYICVTHRSMGRPVIGVAVSDSPTGPFVDAIGYPLVYSDWGDIDPTVFIDDDGQAYLYWGNPNLKYVKLNEDMISYDKETGIVNVPMKEESFGKRSGNPDRATLYEEGPWLYKRNEIYYMVYAASGIPENIAYATGNTPVGPWTYRGIIMPTQGGSFTNHPSVIDYKGKTYFFYHNGALPGGGGFTRSVCVEQFKFNKDGTFPTLDMTKEGVLAISNLNPYVRNEAETIAWETGVETGSNSLGGIKVYDINNGDYIKVKNVDFKEGAGVFSANLSCSGKGGAVELHLDSPDGKLIGTLPVAFTGGDDKWDTNTTNITDASGIHDLFLVFKGEEEGSLFNIDCWQFGKKTKEHKLAAINAVTDQYKIDTVAGSNTAQIKVTAIYTDGKTEDVTELAAVKPDALVKLDKGLITGLNYGIADITVSYGNTSDRVSLYIKDFTTEKIADRLIINNNAGRILPGENSSFSIIAVYEDEHTEDVTTKAEYDNPNKAIAVVSNGVIMAKEIGTTEVTVTYKAELGDVVTSKLVITVMPDNQDEATSDASEPAEISVNGVSITNNKISLKAGEKKPLLFKVLPMNATNRKVSWSSDKPETASVDKYGKVTAVNKGTATITITTEEGGYTALCEVTVTTQAQENSGIGSNAQGNEDDTLADKPVNAKKSQEDNVYIIIILSAIAVVSGGLVIFKSMSHKNKGKNND
jgi:hypothetical protein